ncbi:MAG: hypothetical protein ACYC61_01115 [Isosphaeraceae bacterium]
MAQRVLVAACLLMVGACCAMVGVMWNQSTRAAAQAAEANQRLAELLVRSQTTNEEMLRQLQAMSRPAAPAKAQEWIPVTFKLTVEKPDGPPAVGYEVALERGGGGSLIQKPMLRSSDAAGGVDFGVLHPGDWEYEISAGPWSTTGSLNVMPGTPVTRSIVCPRSPPGQGTIHIRIPELARLAEKGVKIVALFRHKDAVYQAPLKWKTDRSVSILCAAGGDPVELKDPFELHVVYERREADTNGDDFLQAGRVHGHLHAQSKFAATEPIEVDEGFYSLVSLVLIRPTVSKRPAPSRVHEVLTLVTTASVGASVYHSFGDPDHESDSGSIHTAAHGIPVSPAWRQAVNHFEARAGQTSEWEITLPDDLIKATEQRLKAKPQPVQRPSSPGLLLPSPSVS